MINWIASTELPSDAGQAAAPENSLRVNTATHASLMTQIADRLRAKQGFSLATLNLDHIVKLRQNAAFARAYRQHSFVVADGNPIVWLSRLAGHRVELMPGSELIAPLAALAAEMDAPIAVLGATEETLDRASAQLVADNPKLRIVAKIAPDYGFDPEGEAAGKMLDDLDRSGAQICFIALGAPKQEILAARGAAHAPHCGFVSIGAGLDFIAGSQTRAPRIVRSLALEWLWRMLSNPRRLAHRYGLCLLVLPGLALQAIRTRGQS